METSGIVLDTDVIVSDLRGKTSVLRTLEGKDLATTAANAFESFHGAFKSRVRCKSVVCKGSPCESEGSRSG